MPNGTIFAGRALSVMNMGRGGNGRTYPSGMFPDPWSPSHGSAMWPRTAGLCAPIAQCCCAGPWIMPPGDRQALYMDWSRWLGSVSSFNLYAIESASLWDMTRAPPTIADPQRIWLASGLDDDEDRDNDDAAHFVSIIPPCSAMVLVEAGMTARIGDQYKLDVC